GLSVLAGALAGAACYLGNDSGVSHLAAAVGTRTIALFGPSNPRHFRPIGPRVRVLAAETMVAISVEDVLAALREWS
ncbi:MAG: glycosyltransferase family 9 protein, partial [Phycisphaerae bacterium]